MKTAAKAGNRNNSSVSGKIIQFGGRGDTINRLIAGETPEQIAEYWWNQHHPVKAKKQATPKQIAAAAHARGYKGETLARIEAKLDRLLAIVNQ
jgi:hypothetical protein